MFSVHLHQAPKLQILGSLLWLGVSGFGMRKVHAVDVFQEPPGISALHTHTHQDSQYYSNDSAPKAGQLQGSLLIWSGALQPH